MMGSSALVEPAEHLPEVMELKLITAAAGEDETTLAGAGAFSNGTLHLPRFNFQGQCKM